MTDIDQTTATKKRPDMFIHVKLEKEGGKTKIGSRIGAGWFFESDGDVGINIILDAIPIVSGQQIKLTGFSAKD